jgi:voltage-gated potassium channel
VPGIRRRYLQEFFGRIWKFLALFAGVYLLAGVGFYFLEGKRVGAFDSFYWAIVTLSTAGYGDFVPTQLGSKLLTMGVLFTQIFLLGYLISVIGSAATEEAQRRALGTLGTDMREHIVVLGSSALTMAAIRELLAADLHVAVVVERSEEVANVRALGPESSLFATFGAAADRTILNRVNVAGAHSIIVATPDDAANLVAVLNIRALAPKARIIVSVSRPELKETLQSAGVMYVASPGDMGGRICASAAFEPDVAHAVEDLTTETYGAGLQEYVLDRETRVTTQTILEAESLVRTHSGCLVVGYARPKADGVWTTLLNPPPATRLQLGDAIIVMGTLENLATFRHWWGRDQGR